MKLFRHRHKENGRESFLQQVHTSISPQTDTTITMKIFFLLAFFFFLTPLFAQDSSEPPPLAASVCCVGVCVSKGE